jgi:3-oxoadipate enol-lactonase
MSTLAPSKEYRASNGIFFRVEGKGERLVLLHGLLVAGAMFNPLVDLLQNRYRILIPDLRGHGNSGDLDGPYDVATLSADLDVVLAEAGFDRSVVMGYSHGGAVAQQLAHTRPAVLSKLILACTYACNVATWRERVEAGVLLTLLRFLSPGSIGKLMLRLSKPKPTGAIGLTSEQAEWMQSMMAANRSAAMRGAARGLVTFDSRPWLKEIRTPTLVVAGTHDTGVPRHHFEALVSGIPGARGRLVDGAGHTLLWTHTRELADIICAE